MSANTVYDDSRGGHTKARVQSMVDRQCTTGYVFPLQMWTSVTRWERVTENTWHDVTSLEIEINHE